MVFKAESIKGLYVYEKKMFQWLYQPCYKQSLIKTFTFEHSEMILWLFTYNIL